MPVFLSPLAPIRVLALAPVLASLGFLAGCASTPDSHVVSAPPPAAPTTTTTTTTVVNTAAPLAEPVASTVVVTQAPPALQQEVAQARPSSQHMWVPGYWTWRHERYEWMAGHWELPPTSTSVWVAPSWERQGNAYKFTEGYWN